MHEETGDFLTVLYLCVHVCVQVMMVEEEMRQLLRETDQSKRGMEEKVKRLTHALGDLQSDLL